VQKLVRGLKLDIVHHSVLPKGGQATRAGTTRNYVNSLSGGRLNDAAESGSQSALGLCVLLKKGRPTSEQGTPFVRLLVLRTTKIRSLEDCLPVNRARMSKTVCAALGLDTIRMRTLADCGSHALCVAVPLLRRCPDGVAVARID
jgi:hypothetical protein